MLSAQDQLRAGGLVGKMQTLGFEVLVVKPILPTDPNFKQMLASVDLAATKSRLGYSLPESAISCLLGHQEIHRRFLETAEYWTLVLEDDVELVDDKFMLDIESLRDEKSSFPSVIQLFTRGERFVSKDSKLLESGDMQFHFKSIPGQTAAYLINRSAAQLSVENSRIIGPADWPDWSVNVNFKCFYPFSFREVEFGSTIEKPKVSRWKYRARAVSILLGLHWVRDRGFYESTKSYRTLVLNPILMRLLWILRGKPTWPTEKSQGLWLV